MGLAFSAEPILVSGSHRHLQPAEQLRVDTCCEGIAGGAPQEPCVAIQPFNRKSI